MRLLVNEIQFSPVAEILLSASKEISRLNEPLLLLCLPTLSSSFSMAVLESSLVDNGITYRRRFSTDNPDKLPCIKIIDGDSKTTSLKTNPFRLTLSTMIVDGLISHKGDPRKGPLTSVSQAHALAQLISPNGIRTRRLRPWLISGNWINSAMDNTYDPIYSALRDFLLEDGLIKVVPLPEVPEPNVSDYEWIEENTLNAISSRWISLDLEGKARVLSNLVRGSLIKSKPSTSRLEETIWHCVLAPGWSTDLAGQISLAKLYWNESSPKIASSKVIDKLIRDGVI
tara:strand:- start:1897 stop:2751 length:855 start_codon:yes stop_codon:yes gene_type:complete